MNKIFLLLICSFMLLGVPTFFTSCGDKDDSERVEYDGGRLESMFGKSIQDIDNYVGTFHFDEEIYRWYAEDENHARYYFAFGMVPEPVQGAEKGKIVTFSGLLWSVSDRWLKEHESYRKYIKTGLYVYDMDAPQCKYIVDGKTYPCLENVE